MANTEQAQAAGSAYEAEISAWRQLVEERLRSDNGWLTLTGLYWLKAGDNTVGSDPAADVLLPASAPPSVGVIELDDATAILRLDDEKVEPLRDDSDPQGPTRIEIDGVSFSVIKRGEQYGVRVRDRDNPARASFKGRVWYPVDPHYRVTALFTPHPDQRAIPVMNAAGIETPMDNPGYVDFTLGGHAARLQAFAAGEGELWFVFRDTSDAIYSGGRFLYAPLEAGNVLMDFNKAYNPPCAFTPYATCPVPPQENVLPFPIRAGEKAAH